MRCKFGSNSETFAKSYDNLTSAIKRAKTLCSQQLKGNVGATHSFIPSKCTFGSPQQRRGRPRGAKDSKPRKPRSKALADFHPFDSNSTTVSSTIGRLCSNEIDNSSNDFGSRNIYLAPGTTARQLNQIKHTQLLSTISSATASKSHPNNATSVPNHSTKCMLQTDILFHPTINRTSYHPEKQVKSTAFECRSSADRLSIGFLLSQ